MWPWPTVSLCLPLWNVNSLADLSKWAGFTLVSRMLRNAIKLEVWPRARQSCERWLGLGLRKRIGNTPGWKMQTVYVQLRCGVLFIFNWGKWTWTWGMMFFISESGCDSHTTCPHFPSLLLGSLLYCGDFFFKIWIFTQQKSWTCDGLFAGFGGVFVLFYCVCNLDWGLFKGTGSRVSRCKRCSSRVNIKLDGGVGKSFTRLSLL